MSYDHIVKGHIAKLKTPTFWPLLIRFQTTEADWPTECGDGAHRTYYGRYCLSDPHKGEIQINMGTIGWPYNSEVGFKENEVVFAKLDTSDGYFKLKAPMGGLPLEPCVRAVSQFLTDGGSVTKRGVRYTCDQNKLFATGPMLDGLGCVIWDYELQAFVWAGLNGNSFVDGGIYGSAFAGQPDMWSWLGGIQSVNGKNSKFLYRLVTIPGPPVKRYIEQWTPSGTGLDYNHWETPLYEHLFGWYAKSGTNPPEPDYDKPIKRLAYVASPTFTTNDGEWQIQELAYYVQQGTSGHWASTWLYGDRHGDKPTFMSNSSSLRYRCSRVLNDPLGLGMELYDKYVLEPWDVHPNCDVFSILAQTTDRVLVYATDNATWTERIYFVMDRINGNIINLHNWRSGGYGHLDDPQGGAFLSGRAVLWTYDNVNQKQAAFLADTGELREYRYWRDTYTHNTTPSGSVDGQLGWTGPSGSNADYVHRGDLCFIGQKGDIYMIVAECGTEDISSGCTGDQEDFLRVRGNFKIEWLSSRDPVVGATVTVHLAVGPAGEEPDYEDTLTGQTNAGGWVSFDAPCLERTSKKDFVFKFTVTKVEKTEKWWHRTQSVCTEAEHVFEGLPGWWCEEPPDPNPAQFQEGSPFKGQVGGKWYHIMVAVVAEHDNDCVEYRFECEDDPSLNSGWRNVNNVSGTFPDGRSQVGRPHEYWAEVPGGGAPYNGYKWRVQYRACDCDDYEGGTPSNWTSIQNP
jgi:hypothetical protein